MDTATSSPTRDEIASGDGRPAWLRLLVSLSVAVALVDLLYIALIQEVIPPLLVGAALTGVGLALARRRERAAIVALVLTNVLMLTGALQFGAEHLAHPSSGIDFAHGAIGIFGRIAAVAVGVVAWRDAAATGARRMRVAAIGSLAAVLVIAVIGSVTSTGDAEATDDVSTTITGFSFAAAVDVTSGDTLFVDNEDLARHTFTVDGTSLDVNVPARQGVRIPIDLSPGSYEVRCAVAGHEAMTSTLVVR